MPKKPFEMNDQIVMKLYILDGSGDKKIIRRPCLSQLFAEHQKLYFVL